MIPRCEISELHHVECAHCQGSRLPYGYQMAVEGLEAAAGKAWRLRVWDTPAPVVLQAPGTCGQCGAHLRPGMFAFRVPAGVHCEECVR